jgi:hypothetical protein
MDSSPWTFPFIMGTAADKEMSMPVPGTAFSHIAAINRDCEGKGNNCDEDGYFQNRMLLLVVLLGPPHARHRYGGLCGR